MDSAAKKIDGLYSSSLDACFHVYCDLGIPSFQFQVKALSDIRRLFHSGLTVTNESNSAIGACLRRIAILKSSPSLERAMVEGHDDVEIVSLFSIFEHHSVAALESLLQSFLFEGPMLVPYRFHLKNNEEFLVQIQTKQLSEDTLSGVVTLSFPRKSNVEMFRENLMISSSEIAYELNMIMDENYHIEFMNVGFLDFCDRQAFQLGSNIQKVFGESIANKLMLICKGVVQSGSPWTGSVEFDQHHDHECIFTELQISGISDPTGSYILGFSIVGFRKDTHNFLTIQQSKMHDGMADIERMALAGRVASHIIHEINNPVTVINGKAEKIVHLLNETSAAVSPALKIQFSDCATKILKMTERMDRIIRGMKNITRNTQGDAPSNVKISDLVVEVMDLIEVISRKKNITVAVTDNLPNISLNVLRLKITQILINLINNGLDAVPEVGERWVKLDISRDLEWVYFKVIDSGPGIPPAIFERLFESYFTTKGSGQGSGIGLPFSRQVAWDHGGDLFLDGKEPNTCFVLKLPIKGRMIEAVEEENWEEI